MKNGYVKVVKLSLADVDTILDEGGRVEWTRRSTWVEGGQIMKEAMVRTRPGFRMVRVKVALGPVKASEPTAQPA